MVNGKATWESNTMPVAVVDKDNAAEFSKGYLSPPFSIPDLFNGLWGTS